MRARVIESRLNGINLRVRHDYKDQLLEMGIPDIDSLILAPGAKIINNSSYRTVLFLPSSGNGPGFFVKRHSHPGLVNRLKYIFRSSRGRKEWKIGNYMLDSGIRTARPVAAGERRRFRILEKDFLITEAIEGSLTLDKFLEAHFSLPLLPEEIRKKRALIKDLASQMDRMHRLGVFHYDFHAGNILAKVDREDNPISFIMDLHRVSLSRKVNLRKRIVNLGQLNASLVKKVGLTDRLRFLKAYWRAQSLGQIRSLLPRIERATEKTTRHALKKHLKK